MITPEIEREYEFNYLRAHKELQESVIRDIARRIAKTDFTVTETAAWQAEKLQQSGIVFDEVLEQAAKELKITKAEVKRIFKDSETEVFNYDDELLIDAGLSPERVKNISPAMRKTIQAALKKATAEVSNLTMTTAVTSQLAYISAADLAHMQIVSGAFSYTEAVKNAVKSAARQGVTVKYPSGHESSLDVAVRRAALTGVNQTAGKLQMMRADELGCDLMEITAHSGARPEHAVWQGQIVSKSGKEGYLSLSDIGYGDVQGFQGANCRHNWYMYFEGVSSRSYTAEQLRSWREDTVLYGGREMSVYEAVQRQRSMERAIRKTKQELVAYDELIKNCEDADRKIDYEIAFNRQAVLLKGQEARLKDFCNKTGLDRDRYREQVFAKNTEKGIRSFGKSTSMKAVWGNKKATVFNYLPGKGGDSTVVDKDYIFSDLYARKFAGLLGNSRVEKSVLSSCRTILKNRNGTVYEELFAIDAKSGRILTYIKGKQEKSIQMTDKLKKLLTNSKENSIIVVHNHPNSSSFSSVDISTMFNFPSISHTVAAGHDGSVFVISELNCCRDDFLNSFSELEKICTNHRILMQLGNDFSFVYRKV